MRSLLPLAVFLAACASAPPPPAANPAEAEALEAVRGMYADLTARRWDALEKHFLPEAYLTFIGKNGPQRQTIGQFIEVVQKGLEGKEVFNEGMKEGAARVHGDLATVWSWFEGKEGSAGAIKTWSGIDAFTLVKTGGRWRIIGIAVSYDR